MKRNSENRKEYRTVLSKIDEQVKTEIHKGSGEEARIAFHPLRNQPQLHVSVGDLNATAYLNEQERASVNDAITAALAEREGVKSE